MAKIVKRNIKNGTQDGINITIVVDNGKIIAADTNLPPMKHFLQDNLASFDSIEDLVRQCQDYSDRGYKRLRAKRLPKSPYDKLRECVQKMPFAELTDSSTENEVSIQINFTRTSPMAFRENVRDGQTITQTRNMLASQILKVLGFK